MHYNSHFVLLENSENKDNWNQKAWEDLVLKVRLLDLYKPKDSSSSMFQQQITRFVCFILFFFFLQFVSKSLDEVDSEEWVCSLGAEMSAQIQLYTNLPEEKVWNTVYTVIVFTRLTV